MWGSYSVWARQRETLLPVPPNSNSHLQTLRHTRKHMDYSVHIIHTGTLFEPLEAWSCPQYIHMYVCTVRAGRQDRQSPGGNPGPTAGGASLINRSPYATLLCLRNGTVTCVASPRESWKLIPHSDTRKHTATHTDADDIIVPVTLYRTVSVDPSRTKNQSPFLVLVTWEGTVTIDWTAITNAYKVPRANS